MVEWKDERALLGASQFQPPSANCYPRRLIQQALTGLAKVGARGQNASIDTGLGLAVEIGSAVQLMPREVLSNTIDGAATRLAAGSAPRSFGG